MFNNILVYLDGSELAEKILPYAKETAKRFGSTLFLTYFEESRHAPPIARAAVPTSTTPSAFRDLSTPLTPAHQPDVPTTPGEELTVKEVEVSDYLDKLTTAVRSEGLAVEYVVRKAIGKAGEAIVNYAHHNEIDLVATCAHGRSALRRSSLGNIADYVINHIELPVLVINV